MKILPITLHSKGAKLKTYCLVDDASNFTMILDEAAESLGLDSQDAVIPIATAREECTPC